MSELNVGIVGLGWVAGAHIETFKSVEGATVSAICSRRDHDEGDLYEQYGLPLTAYQDYDKMLSDPDLDIIDICTPHPLHPEQAIAAAEAGKHVIIEKPIGLKYEDVLNVRKALKANDVQSCVCFEVRFSGQGDTTKSTIERGLVGDVHYAEVDYYHGVGPWYGGYDWNIKKDWGGSSLLTAGCHAMDLLLWFMDDEVEEVTSLSTKSSSEKFEPYEYDTTSVTLLKFKGGQIGKVASVIDSLQPYYFHVHLVGSEGSVLDDKFHSEKIEGLSREHWSELATPLVDSGDVDDHPYLPQFQAFVDSIEDGSPMPRTGFDTALESHRVVFAADRSAELGRPVQMDEIESPV